MKENDSHDELMNELRSLPEPNYEKTFNDQIQADIHQNLINYLHTHNDKNQSRNKVNKWKLGLSSLAAALLILCLALSTNFAHDSLNPNAHDSIKNASNKQIAEPAPQTHPLEEHTFSNSIEAVNSISAVEQAVSQNYPSNKIVDLGLDINADYYKGAGYYKYKWNEGRWTIYLAGQGNSSKGTQMAKNVVSYLHTNTLPAPDQKGVITILPPSQATGSITQTSIARQVGNTVLSFKQSGDPINTLQAFINSSSSTRPSNNTIKKQNFPSSSKALDALAKTEQNLSLTYPSGTQVDLGLGINGVLYKNSEHYKYTWYEGRWTILLVGKADSLKGKQVAKSIVTYLHTHYLPAPSQKGVIIVNQPSSSHSPLGTANTISWQVKNKVFTLKQTGDPIKALQTIINKH
ncbi:hypothetical protein PU629_20325 [Pullulanibacillus sp. KACC 23026]|uniref:hypothetical protein n=1 Tax=Pullulanibacillus sp. KACC 23026 TaxID=3028315 RepID=UPI0023B128C9|nr:hypothetical protein [Pullulanibacillus sp. KACC 23026]WEG12416.1 hypothetical protein PU629_20325 [Pullulanibacillus sp. KACC 23026]